MEVKFGGRIPITRKEQDLYSISDFNGTASTILFNRVGVYSIKFIVSADIEDSADEFDETRDFVAIGFRKVNSDDIYIGGSKWIRDGVPAQVYGEGILTITDIATPYELVNMGKNSIFLNSPDLQDTISKSYFVNSVVTLIITSLGR